MKTTGPISCIFSVAWLAGDIKILTHLSQRVGHIVPGVVVWPCLNKLVLYVRVNLIAPFPLKKNYHSYGYGIGKDWLIPYKLV